MRKSKSSPLELGPNLCLLATVTVVYTFYSQFVSFIFSEPYAIPLMTAYDICNSRHLATLSHKSMAHGDRQYADMENHTLYYAR